jgi:hypothetical protein
LSGSYGDVVKLRLARLVAVSFGWPRQRIPDLEAERGDVTVRVLARQEGKQSALLVLVAEVPVEPLPLSDEHLLPVPTEPTTGARECAGGRRQHLRGVLHGTSVHQLGDAVRVSDGCERGRKLAVGADVRPYSGLQGVWASLSDSQVRSSGR